MRLHRGMLALGADRGRGHVPPGRFPKHSPIENRGTAAQPHKNTLTMITQNPIIGSAKKKIGNVYSRTLYGKNVVQTCPYRGNETKSEISNTNRQTFTNIIRMANLESQSMLNNIFYNSPTGRNRRQEWTRQLMTMKQKSGNRYFMNPTALKNIGGNITASKNIVENIVENSTHNISKSATSPTPAALQNEIPLVYLIEPTTATLMNCLNNTTIDNTQITITNLPEKVINKTCYFIVLWKVNMNTSANPILRFGSYSYPTARN